jgi:hypothetical protein
LSKGEESMKKSESTLIRRKLLSFAILGLLAYCPGIIGCAPTKLYSVNMNYDAGRAAIPTYLKADDKGRTTAVGITEFIDARQVADPIVIGRVVEKDGMNTLVLPKYKKPTQAVAFGIKKYLLKAGYKNSSLAGQWDLKEETIPKTDSKIIIGGSIEELELTCRKGFPTDSYKARIKLKLVIADGEKGKILYRSSVESNSSLEHVSFSEERMEEQINAALSDAIEKVFEDRKMAQEIKEKLAE